MGKDGVDSTPRHVVAQDASTAQSFGNNRITNTKYTVWNFVPLALWLQVKTHMNRYFLLIACLQLWSEIAPVSPVTTWVPLLFIFALSALREALDDLKRYRSDKIANERPYTVCRGGSLVPVKSEDICVGDICFITGETEFPCDMVLLGTSEEDGCCFVQTANIDGETDLKPRYAVAETARLNEAQLRDFRGEIECEAPSARIDSFVGRLRTNPTAPFVSLSAAQLLLQATHLRNTRWVYGVAVYTGNQTKVGMNKHDPPSKFTRADSFINRVAVCIFVIQILIAASFGAAGAVLNIPYMTIQDIWFLGQALPVPWYQYIVIPLRFLLLCSAMVPISLKVTMDLVKYAYAQFVDWDAQMFDDVLEQPARASNSNVAEDAGQIQYILTDKTGTLTENIMVFRYCTIGGVMYGRQAEAQDALTDPKLAAAVHMRDERVLTFLRALCLCNTVIPEPDARLGAGHVAFKAASPDEEALVKAAQRLGVVLRARHGDQIELDVCGERELYTLVHTLQFSSARRRMSVLVAREGGPAYLFSKGGDDVILERLEGDQDALIRTTVSDVEGFAHFGLRTLMVGMRTVPPEVLSQWRAALSEATTQMTDREAAVTAVYALMETHLQLLGATAIEDRLQDEVPQTIGALRRAGVRFWMLTGDKFGTAVQIALACHLLAPEPSGRLLALRAGPEAEVLRQLDTLESGLGEWGLRETSLVVEGSAVDVCLAPLVVDRFATLCLRAHAVVACRVSPQQKALLTRLVRARGLTTLAIGDGGNDVGMIQEAHVGVGIAGREGLQAARAADYSFGRFRFLKRLLLIHGRYAYQRTAVIAQYSFYKSAFVCLMQLGYAFVSRFSGTSLFTGLALMLYNILFTGLPPLFYALDKDVTDDVVLANPELYLDAQHGTSLNPYTMCTWFLRALYQATIICLFSFLAYDVNYVHPGNGQTGDYIGLGMVAYTSGILVQTCTIALETHYWTWLNHLAIWGTLVLYFAIMSVAQTVVAFDFYETMNHLYSDPTFWLVVIVSTAACIVPVVALKTLRRMVRPSLRQLRRAMGILRPGEPETGDAALHPSAMRVQALPGPATVNTPLLRSIQDAEDDEHPSMTWYSSKRSTIFRTPPSFNRLRKTL